MRKYAALMVLVAVTLVLGQERAAAQDRHPKAADVAVGFDLGFYIPDEDFHVGFNTQGLVEFYFTHNISLRGTVGWTKQEFIDLDDLFLEQGRATLNLVYNWEKELWHPFITVGGGYYHIRDYIDDAYNPGWVSRWGVNFGGGVEYFSRPTVTIKVEGTYHWIERNHPRGEPRGFSLTAGLKKYF